MKKFIYLFICVFALSFTLSGCGLETNQMSPDTLTTTAEQQFDKHDVSYQAVTYALGTVEEDGVYTTPATVAAYLYTFHKLPSNFITKNEATKLGWDSGKGNLNEVAPGKSIGGDRFGNYEGLLPRASYHECDVNYESGRRGSERIVYSDDWNIYYTSDHYESFKPLL